MNPITSVSRYQGFSLIELMIAMVIGLILLAGVATVFISTQQSSQTQRDLNNAQEALRYTHQSISRMVRIGAIDEGSGPSQLIILFNRSDATPDCLGGTDQNDPDDPVEVRYSLNSERPELECSVNGGQCNDPNDDQCGVVAREITAFSLAYESLTGNDWTTGNAAEAVSVRVNLTFGDFIDTSFVATSRSQVMDGYFALANAATNE